MPELARYVPVGPAANAVGPIVLPAIPEPGRRGRPFQGEWPGGPPGAGWGQAHALRAHSAGSRSALGTEHRMTPIHRITTTIAAAGAVAGLALVPATGALASSHSSFIGRFHRISPVASTVPHNGDVNP